MKLLEIFAKYGIDLKRDNEFRHPIDILEDMYLKLNNEEYAKITKWIAEVESQEGHIFNTARNKPYK
jgi:hypothetical protein